MIFIDRVSSVAVVVVEVSQDLRTVAESFVDGVWNIRHGPSGHGGSREVYMTD